MKIIKNMAIVRIFELRQNIEQINALKICTSGIYAQKCITTLFSVINPGRHVGLRHKFFP
jgi:hypothetical protein